MRILIYILSILFIGQSCQNREQESVETIGETEYYFDERLSSISMNDDGSYLVGSETGDLFFFKDNHRLSFDLGEDRIYKTERDVTNGDDTIFWIGIRNSGLQKWTKKNDKLEKAGTYYMNFKGDKYSPYDFKTVDNSLFLATSQGLYSLDKRQDTDSLTLLYPSIDFLSKHNGTTYVVHNIAQLGDSVLVASSQGGLLWLNTNERKVQLSFEGEHIEYVAVYQNTVYAICHEYLYLIDANKNIQNKIRIGKEPKLYYQAQGIHYLVGKEELLLSNDLKDFFTVKLKRSIPIYSRNLILPDTLNNFTYLLTENAIWRISNNIDVFKSNKAIKLSCFSGEKVYYLSALNELYVQEKDQDKAKWLYTFPRNEAIEWMDVKDDHLYFYNTDNEFQKINISSNWVKNLLFRSSETILRSEAKITAAYVKQYQGKLQVYLGIQDGLITVNEQTNKIDTISELSKAYVTSMFSHNDADRLYISTLNNGVFYINSDMQVKQIQDTQHDSFIKDVITTNSHSSNLIMLTNQQIKSEHPHDSIRVKGYQKLIYVNDSIFYALPEFGVHRFTVSQDSIEKGNLYYKDIRFNANGAIAFDNKIVLISNIGASIIPVGKESSPSWVNFEKAVNIEVVKTTLFTIVILLITITITFVITRRRSTGVSELNKHKQELLKRIKDLIIYYNILDDIDSRELLNLKNEIDSIDITFKKQRHASTLLDNYSQEIAKWNRQIALHLPKKLDEQISEIEKTNSFEKSTILALSKEVKNQDDVERIKSQINANEIWLTQRSEFINSLDHSINKLLGTIEIKDVNKGLLSKLLAIKENEKQKSLDELTKEYDFIKNDVQNLDSPGVLLLIKTYLDDIDAYIEEKVTKNNGLSFLLVAIQKSKTYLDANGNIAGLKYIKSLGDQIEILKTLDEIKHHTTKYKDIYNRLVQENNNHVNKKFDKELASYIEDHTINISREILSSISKFYSKLLLIEESKAVIDILKLNNTEGQHARVLALLIADFRIKRVLIPGMLGIYGNLNPVISRLLNDRIKKNEDILRKIQRNDKEKNMFVYYILQLLD